MTVASCVLEKGRVVEQPDERKMFYAPRHTCVGRALKVGAPPKAAAGHCGTSLAMIQRHYSKFIPEDRRRYAALAASTLQLDRGEAELVVGTKAAG